MHYTKSLRSATFRANHTFSHIFLRSPKTGICTSFWTFFLLFVVEIQRFLKRTLCYGLQRRAEKTAAFRFRQECLWFCGTSEKQTKINNTEKMCNDVTLQKHSDILNETIFLGHTKTNQDLVSSWVGFYSAHFRRTRLVFTGATVNIITSISQFRTFKYYYKFDDTILLQI